MPHPGEHATPFCVRLQLTPLLVPSFVTVAVNGCAALKATLATGGATDTEMGRIVMPTLLNAPPLVAELAWSCTPSNRTKQNLPQEPPKGGVKCAGEV